MNPVQPESGSRLEQLCSQYNDAKSRADEAAANLKAITDGIKLELTTAYPEQPKLTVASDYLERPLTLTETSRWTVDTKKLKEDNPALYVQYARQSKVWVLKAS